MKFHFGHLSKNGFTCEELALVITESPFPHIEIGRPNKSGKVFKLWIGMGLYKKLKKVEVLCPREGKTELGKCPDCGVLVAPEKLKAIPSGQTQMVNGVPVELVAKTMEHDLVKKATQIGYGSLEFGKKRDTLLVVEEKAKDKTGRMGLLIRAESPPHGHAAIDFIQGDKDNIRAKINARTKGEIWTDPKNPKAGVAAERFMVLVPGDRIKITRTYSDGKEDVMMIGMMPDFTLKSIQPTDEMQAAAPEPEVEEVADEPAPAEIERALQDGVERFKM